MESSLPQVTLLADESHESEEVRLLLDAAWVPHSVTPASDLAPVLLVGGQAYSGFRRVQLVVEMLGSIRNGWRDRLGMLWTEDQVEKLLRKKNLFDAAGLARAGILLSVPSAGQRLFPAFQFSSEGLPFPIVSDVIKAFAEAEVSPLTVAAWFVTNQEDLSDRTPAEWLIAEGEQGEAAVLESARRAAARLRQ